MSWQDREYTDGGSQRFGEGFQRAMTWSVSLGTWFGVNVKVHWSLLLFIAFEVLLGPLSAKLPYSVALKNAATGCAMVFGVILLHEYGHCIGAWMVGGEADEILMSPLGGLAFARPPHRPGALFWTVAAGPLVNVLICLLSAGGLWLLNSQLGVIPWNPLSPKIAAYSGTGLSYYLWWLFLVSWVLLLLTMLPIYPLDGAQMVQAILWPIVGYGRSMMIAVTTGMVGSVVVAIAGLMMVNFLLMSLAACGFMVCYQRRKMMLQVGIEGIEETSKFASSLRVENRKRRKLSKRVVKKARARAAFEQAEQERIDTILAKVSAHGMQSLTWSEKRALHKATARQRERDFETTPYDKR